MDIHDDHIPEDLFAEFTREMPECCVEIVVEHDDTVLLARRTNAPAKGEWFWPGGRLYKGEELEHAAHRVAREELGIDIEILGLLGVYSHFWETSAVGDGPSRHTVNIAYHVTPAEETPSIELDAQHDEYRFIDSIEPDLHEYVKQYLVDAVFFS